MSVDRLILEVVEQEELGTQAELAAELQRRGVELNQSTLSRHLTKLGIRKQAGVYVRPEQTLFRIPSIVVTEAPPNLLVIKSPPGHAQPIAFRLDESRIQGLAGTVGGDDTVIVVVSPPELLSSVRREIQLLIG